MYGIVLQGFNPLEIGSSVLIDGDKVYQNPFALSFNPLEIGSSVLIYANHPLNKHEYKVSIP